MNVVAGFFAVGACYVAFFNFIFLKRNQGTQASEHMVRTRQKYRMTTFAFSAAALFFMFTVFTSSVSTFEIAFIFVVIGGLTNLLFRIQRGL